MTTPKKVSCVIGPVDTVTRRGRDPFAPPGTAGNRWIKYGCDGAIPSKYKAKLQKAVSLAYALKNKKAFVEAFDKIVRKLTAGKGMSFLDAIDSTTLNLAETSKDPAVQKEIADAERAAAADPRFQTESGFTKMRKGNVYIREFALHGHNEKQLAALIVHECAHVAGVPGHGLAEIALLALDQKGYRRFSH